LVPQDHILRDNGITNMDSDFDDVLDGLRSKIIDFVFNTFTSKDIVPPKT